MYQRIEDYGIIGNMHTAALVSKAGSIDWFCFPRFDSPSVFAALLDDEKGGFFRIAPATEPFSSQQLYWPATNVLITRFRSTSASGEVIDFMPMTSLARQPLEEARPLIRVIQATRGRMRFRMECRPAFNYAREQHESKLRPEGAFLCAPSQQLALITQCELKAQGAAVIAEFTLEAGETRAFLLRGISSSSDQLQPFGPGQALDLMRQTVDYWRNWLSRCAYQGRWREMVHRSALVLELLAYEPTGAVVAAPTTSLPENIGGVRNWDYRCSWIRDSSFTVYGLLRVGLADEATRFMSWIESRCRELGPDGTLQTVYGIDGRHSLPEETLSHLKGYKDSRPVRIGNAACQQLQMDIYGELMDSIYLYNKYVEPISSDLWKYLRRMANWVSDNWRQPDNGIWEVRGGPKHFVYSKLMCWVAMDRAIRLAHKRSFPADFDRWVKSRDAIYEEILSRGWNEKHQTFVQSYDGDALDASVLLMSMVFFMSPTDPRMLKTLEAIGRCTEQGGLLSDGAVARYDLGKTEDGVEGCEGTFNMCSFWYVEALTRAGRTNPQKIGQALLLFEKSLKQANHLGLFSEETGPCGEALGNFPQAFTHLGLISAAFNLDRALGGGE
ncbi:MAG TPA: glycoside hydrolase family 15 protein [Terriglobia bacterium]|nr:glycoside hydrolase family 15 protein [Terriglobia bacterium]